MKQFIAIILLLSLSCQCLVKLGLVTWYELNKEYIAKYLCENKEKPELKCCGKCYLKKQLRKAENGNPEQQKSLPSKSSKTELLVFTIPGQTTTITVHFPAGVIQNPARSYYYGISYHPAVFHPPAV